MLHKNWWKILGVMLIIYSIVAGMLIPLKPGIYTTTPSSANAGETIIVNAEGYNTAYDQVDPKSIRSWLKIGNDFALAAKLTNKEVAPQFGSQVWTKTPIVDTHEKAGTTFPFRSVIYESLRNTYYHVPMWFAMLIILFASVIQSILFLIRKDMEYDRRSVALTTAGTFFGFLGLVSGMVWAAYTWGAPWSGDIKQNMTAIALLIYLAYFILRASFEDEETRARISAVFNIFSFATLIPLLYVIPRLVDSLHPGSGGNPAFGSDDLDNTMRMIFYPAIIGWILLGVWMSSLHLRYLRLRERLFELD